MSYLNSVRLHFAGRFQANVSTVNNDPRHFDIDRFRENFQEMQTTNRPNGWFNPQGDAAWRLLGCQVTSAWMSSATVKDDGVLSCIVADSDGRAPAKLADLDSQQQLVSEIWGLTVRIADPSGTTLMSGRFEPAAFMDIWNRATGSGASGDIAAGSMFQSTLTDVQWGDVAFSPFLTALQAAASDGLLSIKFNVDAFNLSYNSPDFMTGRIVGTIGPAAKKDPKFMVLGRQLMAAPSPGSGGFFTPAGGLNFCAAVVSQEDSCLYLDLGNAISTGIAGSLNNLGNLVVNCGPSGAETTLGVIPACAYADVLDWYPTTAGVVALPLSASQLQACASAPISISGNNGISISEWPSGAWVRADQFVFRLEPGQQVEIPVYATRFGTPFSGVNIAFTSDASMLQAARNLPVASPANAITITNSGASALTDSNGMALLTLHTSDPGNPRGYIDGQVYGIRASFADAALNDPASVNQWCFISLLLWNSFTPGTPLTWADIGPIFQQYANLYPVMNRFLNLGFYDDVVANTRLLTLAFQIDITDPNSMPVTRDLSPAKRTAILSWLANPLQGDAPAHYLPPKPPLGEALLQAREAPSMANDLNLGGKTAAAALRIIHQKD